MPVSGLTPSPNIQEVLNRIAEVRARTASSLDPNAVAGGPGQAKGAVGSSAAPSFVNALKNSLDAVNADQNSVTKLSQAYELGNSNVDLTEVMVAVQKANVSFQSAVQVRNRLVSAYHDMMNMQI